MNPYFWSDRSLKKTEAIVLVAVLLCFVAVKELYDENASLKVERDRYQGQVGLLEGKLKGQQDELDNLRRTVTVYETKIDQLQLLASNGRALKRPTLGELTFFLALDRTNNETYGHTESYYVGSENFWVEYQCSNYAGELKQHAAQAGLNISQVTVNVEGRTEKGEFVAVGHVLNGAILDNGKWVWIEPQTDAVFLSLHAPVSIGDCCFIGSLSIVRMGVKIGDHVIIGAHSFVNSDTPSNSIAMGCPARIVGDVKVQGDKVKFSYK